MTKLYKTFAFWASVALIFFSLSFPAAAYYSTMDTADLIEEGQHKLTGEAQFITSFDEGVNAVFHYDTRINDEAGFRGNVGFGTTDFHFSGFYKWAPIPDIEGQPGIAVLMGAGYASFSGKDDLSLKMHPIFSKKFAVDIGDLTPYGAIPFGLRSMDSENDFVIQAVIGSKWKPNGFENTEFLAEIGIDISDTFTYFSVAASTSFDDWSNIRFD